MWPPSRRKVVNQAGNYKEVGHRIECQGIDPKYKAQRQARYRGRQDRDRRQNYESLMNVWPLAKPKGTARQDAKYQHVAEWNGQEG